MGGPLGICTNWPGRSPAAEEFRSPKSHALMFIPPSVGSDRPSVSIVNPHTVAERFKPKFGVRMQIDLFLYLPT